MTAPSCASRPAEWWHPDPTDYETGEAAQHICSTCPLRQSCRDSAVARGESKGIWGGLWFDRAAVRSLKSRKSSGAPKTHCKYGHPFAGDNLRLYTTPKGHTSRVCVTCRNEAKKRHRRGETTPIPPPVLDYATLLKVVHGVDGAEFGIVRGHTEMYVRALFELGWKSSEIKNRLGLAGSYVKRVREAA